MSKPAINNFVVKKEDKTITMERSFNAPLDPVWAAWTEADILCQWWAPAPWKCVIKSLDFREGGRWLYAMEGPDGDRHWGLFDYTTIRPKTFYSGSDSFCDENGTPSDTMPRAKWENRFSENDGETVVRIVISFSDAEHVGQILKMGFKEGMQQDFVQLDALLASGKVNS